MPEFGDPGTPAHRPFPVSIPSREPFGDVMVAHVSTVAHAVRAPPRVRTRPGSITSKRAAARAIMAMAASASGSSKVWAKTQRGPRRR